MNYTTHEREDGSKYYRTTRVFAYNIEGQWKLAENVIEANSVEELLAIRNRIEIEEATTK